MKKILVILAVLFFASQASGKELGNGITVTDNNEKGSASTSLPAAEMQDDSKYDSGSSAGGLEPERKLFNGITYFDRSTPSVRQKNKQEPPSSNGITVFG